MEREATVPGHQCRHVHTAGFPRNAGPKTFEMLLNPRDRCCLKAVAALRGHPLLAGLDSDLSQAASMSRKRQRKPSNLSRRGLDRWAIAPVGCPSLCRSGHTSARAVKVLRPGSAHTPQVQRSLAQVPNRPSCPTSTSAASCGGLLEESGDSICQLVERIGRQLGAHSNCARQEACFSSTRRCP